MLKPITKIVDFFQLDHIYDRVAAFGKSNTRPMSDEEIEIAKSIFSKHIDYQVVRIDEKSFSAKRLHVKYVSFNTINSWGKMSHDVLIHELVHIWQYQKLGSVYIAEALAAQRTTEGYDYGGCEALENALREEKNLTHFNFEQQGDIVQDFFRIRHGFYPQWGDATKNELAIYEKIIQNGFDSLDKT
jgi:hypothetical protein